MSEVVYTPDSRLRRPRELLREMLADLLSSRELARRLFLRDLRVQYRRSLLGAAWLFIPAVAAAAILTLATRARILNVGATAVPYPVFVVLGMTLWQTFLDALNGPMLALSAESRLLARFNVAPEAIVLSKLGEAVVNCGVRSLLAALLFAWYGVPVGWTAPFALLGVLALVCLGAAAGLILAPLGALYQDVAKSLPIVTSVWFFVTPVVYPVPPPGPFGTLVQLNPVTPLLVTARELASGSAPTMLAAFLAVAALALALLAAGWLVYRVSMPIVLERARF
ncbi:MAG TPA: ABC transporter permease [Vicinamibacteria bacterium]|jgi:lipopolysaccharide transport system permease protein